MERKNKRRKRVVKNVFSPTTQARGSWLGTCGLKVQYDYERFGLRWESFKMQEGSWR